MKKLKLFMLISFIITLSVFIAHSQTPDWVWANSGGGSGMDRGSSLSTDNEGNVIVTGYFNSNASFSGNTLTSKGMSDLFVAKYSNTGSLIWIKTAGGTGPDQGLGVTTDKNNNIYVTGSFCNTITFGTTTFTNYSSTYDIFIVKFDKNGSLVWAKQAGGTGADEGYSIVCDENNNVITTGYYQPSAAFDSITISSGDVADHSMYIAKYDQNGKIKYVRTFGGRSNCAKSVAIDSDNNIIVAGNYSKSITIKGKSYTAQGFYDPILIKLSKNGDPIWSLVGSSSNTSDEFNDVIIDQSSNIYVAGTFGNTLSFGTSSLTCAGSVDAFICKFDSSGIYKWGSAVGGTDFDQGLGICCNSTSILLTGFQKPPIGKGCEVFYNKYDFSGNLKETSVFGGTSDDYGRAISYDKFDNFYLTGDFNSSISFGSNDLTGQWFEMFIAKYGMSKPPSIIILEHPQNNDKCLGESVTFRVYAQGKNLKYQWKFNGSDISSATDTFLIINNLQLKDAGKYSCTVSDSSFSITSNDAVLTVGTGPLITSQPKDKTIEKGKNVTFSVSATGSQLTYQWQKNGQDILGATSSTYSKNNVQYADSGFYSCIVIDWCGVDTSDIVKLKVIHNSGIDENVPNKLLVYPNPSSDKVFIQIPANYNNVIKLKIYSSTGKLVKDFESANSPEKIISVSVNDFPKGIYYIILETQNGNFNNLLLVY